MKLLFSTPRDTGCGDGFTPAPKVNIHEGRLSRLRFAFVQSVPMTN
jgi:hypothetical protein